MIDFDFHNLLFPTEFEKLCRDIVDIRDSPIKFTTYRRGKDGGIDFKSTNTPIKIIGQCKLYNPAHYTSFFTSLKKEVQKCRRQNPSRYIICTNLKLSPDQAKEIHDLFKGYIIAEEDIIEGEKLNKYLGNEQYQHLLKVYSKLLVPNLQFVEQALEKIVNQKYYNKTAFFLKQIYKEHKLFHNTQILKKGIDILEKNKIIILTGNPGVGKTTTAKMIVNYFLNQKVKKILFLTDNDFSEIEGLYQDNQLIVVDDFWGQNFSPLLKDFSRLRNFNRIIEDCKESNDRYLILTSREYIIKDVLNHSEHETKHILDADRFIINLDNYSNEDKVRIFLNHLLYYDFEKPFFEYLKYSDTLENVIDHRNYSPRHIEYFIRQFLSADNQNSYHFYSSFLKYLNKPSEYWNNNFNNLNGTSKLILLILLISADPIDLSDLEKSFNVTQTPARNILNEKIEPLAFNHELRVLEDFYLVSEKEDYSDRVLICFQSPGIKDFLLQYLRTDGKAWVKPLLENALFFNQLNFIFCTEEDEIDDNASDMPLVGKKILLAQDLQKTIKSKLITEFQTLNFCFQGEKVLYEHAFSTKHTTEETKYWKLFLLNSLFDISKDENLDIRNFIIAEVKKDIDSCGPDNWKIVNARAMDEFPRIIKLIKPYTKLNADHILNCYWDSATLTSEYDSLFEFKDIFPDEFELFINKNSVALKKAIKYHIIDDIDYYRWYDLDVELDTHLDYMIEEVCKKYKIRLTAKFIKEIEDMAERSIFIVRKSAKIKTKKKAKPKSQPGSKSKYNFKPKKFATILGEYLPEDSYEEFKPVQYLKNFKSSKELLSTIEEAVSNEESLLKPFTSGKEIFSSFIQLIDLKENSLLSFNEYTILDTYFTLYCKHKGINIDIFKELYCELAKDSSEYDFSITGKQLKTIFDKYNISKHGIDVLSPIIIADSKWYNFSNYDFRVYFIAEYLGTIKSDDEFKQEAEDYSLYIYDGQLLRFLKCKSKNRLDNVILIPELQRFISCINVSSPKESVLSFLTFFAIEFDLKWNKQKREFEESSSSNSEMFIEIIIQYLGIDFSTTGFEIYFLKDYYSKENIQKYFIDTKVYNRLYKHTVENFHKMYGQDILTKEEAVYFDFKLYELAKDDTFYSILQAIGIEKYILTLFNKITQISNSIALPNDNSDRDSNVAV